MKRLRRWVLRLVTTVARIPMAADRRGLRWLLSGRVMPGGPIAIVTHRGRRSGKRYRTVLEVFMEDTERGEFVMLPARGEKSDWYRNALAGGVEQIRLRGEDIPVGYRQLTEDEVREALVHYRREHPLWGRMILWGMARQAHVSGDVFTGLAKVTPLLALHPV